ncbi:phage terminase large subunit [Microvirga sp. 2YAF29]|uniref:phage terminase large subunit n=1 Tax=Microvirga sp. 2YAF29 TaxID=3233031 RepID=UPI003F993381
MNDLSHAALRAALREDFAVFCNRAFSTVDQRTPLGWNWHLDTLSYYFQEAAAGRIKRLLITIPPRHLKSFCGSVALPAWILGRDPRVRIICASYGSDLSTTFSNDCRKIMMEPWYRQAFPHTRLSSTKNTQSEFQTTKGGGRLATSVEGMLTGRGANFLLLDDLMKPMDAASETKRKNVIDFYKGTAFSRLDTKLNDVIIIIMQRLHQDDLAGHLLEHGGGEWTHVDLPAIADTDENILIGPNRYHFRKVGDLLHPEREPQSVLDELKRTLGSSAFSAQYLQRPIPQDGEIFNWAWFRTFRTLPVRGEYDEIVQSWDPASKTGADNDYSVCTTWLVQEGRYYLLDIYRERLNFPNLRRRIVELAELHQASVVLIEDKGAGQEMIAMLQEEGRLPIIPVMPLRDKVERAIAQTLQIEAGRVFIPESASWLEEFKTEALTFPNGRHDDQIDSMVQFLKWIKERRNPWLREI